MEQIIRNLLVADNDLIQQVSSPAKSFELIGNLHRKWNWSPTHRINGNLEPVLEWHPLIFMRCLSGEKKVFCIEIFAHVASVVVSVSFLRRGSNWILGGYQRDRMAVVAVVGSGTWEGSKINFAAKACSVWSSRREDRSPNSTTYRQF